MAKSIDWKRRVILTDFQDAEDVTDASYTQGVWNDKSVFIPKVKIMEALSITDDDWELEWSFIRRYLTPKERAIMTLWLAGYTQQEIADKNRVSQKTISVRIKKTVEKIINISK